MGGGGLRASIWGSKDPLPSSVLVEMKALSFSTGRVGLWAHRLDPLGFRFQSTLTSCGPDSSPGTHEETSAHLG